MRSRGFEIVTAYQDKDIQLPVRQTAKSAGYDLAAAAAAMVLPGQITIIPTGLKAYMRDDEYLGIHIRSGLAVKQGLGLVNSQGIIDADYYNNPGNEGHIMIAVINYGDRVVEIAAGQRIAQGIFYRYLTTDGDDAGGTREGGLGSTNK